MTKRDSLGLVATQAHQIPDERTVGHPMKDDILQMPRDAFPPHQEISDNDAENRENAGAEIRGCCLLEDSRHMDRGTSACRERRARRDAVRHGQRHLIGDSMTSSISSSHKLERGPVGPALTKPEGFPCICIMSRWGARCQPARRAQSPRPRERSKGASPLLTGLLATADLPRRV